MGNSTRTGIWLTVASGLTFALSGPFGKALMNAGWSPGGVVLTRLTGAAVVLTTLAAILDRPGLRTAHRHLGTVTGYGVLALAVVQATFFLALEHLSIGVTLMIQFLAPILVIAWDWLVRHRRPSVLTLLGAALALAGASLVIDVFGDTRISLVGIGWAGLSMIGNAAFFLVSERARDDLSPVVLLAGGMTVGALATAATVAAGLFTATATTASTALGGRSLPWFVTAGLLVLLGTVTPYLCGVAGGIRIGSTLMSLVLLSEVGFGVLAAWLLVGQTATAAQVAGGAAIVSGIALARLGGAGVDAEAKPVTAQPNRCTAPPSPV